MTAHRKISKPSPSYIEKVCKSARAAGFDSVEFCVSMDGGYTFTMKMDGLEKERTALDDALGL